ncbi:vitamin K epoxide reductase complex subunit 1-like protein 1 [Oppia nitens]|uniref:vitamin K epoxide reductase complex subunit 1-like protein 1 n=1 Tax=Oppia nitens TaxID=1686743 RepID=UPI0023DBE8ED|nr:vitamin K epoxide reductase complex subunit 1-like protein 1 [Oppia nitens]
MVSTKQLISQLSRNTIYLSCISSIGLLLSIYSLSIEIRHQNGQTYDAFCDINSYISCSKVFLSSYGKGFGLLSAPLDLPNPVFGVILYSLQAIVANILHTNLLLTKLYIIVSLISNLGSLYLAYILAFVLKNFCIVCVAIYVINFLQLMIAYNRYRIITSFKRLKKD